MRRITDTAVLLSVLIYPVAVHVAVSFGAENTANAILVFLALGILVLLLTRRPIPSRWWISLYASLVIVGTISIVFNRPYALFLPPILINSGLALLFFSTLQKEKTPIIERIMKVHDRAVSSEKQQYARMLTKAWIGFFLTMATVALVLALFGSLYAWSLFANIVNYVLVGVFFLGQLLWASLRFKDNSAKRAWDILHDTKNVFRSNIAVERSVDTNNE